MYEINDTTTFVEQKAGDEVHKFYLLQPAERLEIVANLKKAKRAEIIENLDAAELKGESRYGELSVFNERWNDTYEFIEFVNSLAGDLEIPARALRLDDKDKAREIANRLTLNRDRMLAFKAALTGLVLKSQEPKGTPDPNAQTPTVYKPAGETGSQTQQSYGTGSPA